MPQLETKLVASLVDKISAPARKASEALRGLSKAGSIKFGVFSGLDREIGRVNRQLADTRGRMLEVTAQAYVMAKALQAPILAYADFEKGLVGLGQKSNKTLEQMKDIGKQFREMAPGMHQSPDALVGVMDTLVGAGVEFDVAKKSLGAISKASHAMNADIKSISDASVSFLQNMKIGADKLGEAWGIAAAAANAGKFELEDVARQFPGVASFGAMRGMTGIEGERELLGILEGLSTRTATAEAAATQMRNVLQKMDSQETTNRFSKAIEAENIRLQDAVKRHGKFDLGGTIMARARRMGISQVRAFVDITQEMIAKGHGKVRLSDLISDAEFLSGMQNIIDGLRDIDSIIAETKKNSAGFLDKAQAERAKTLSSKLTDLSNAFSGLNIEIGTSLAPMLGDITERLKGLTEWVRNLSAAHPNLIRNVTIATAGFVALNVGIVALRYSFLNLKVAALASFNVMKFFVVTPLGAALTAIGAAVYLIYENWDKIKALMPNVAKAVESAINWMKEHWSELPGKVWEVAVAIKDKLLNTDWIQVGRDMISGLWTGMKEWLNKILAGVGDFVGKIKGLFVGSASASTGGSSTSMGGSTGGGSYTAAAERMRRLSGGGASGGPVGGGFHSFAEQSRVGRGTLDKALAGEGGGFNVRGVKNMNPGNIAYGPWARAHGATGSAGTDTGHGVAVFPSHAAGAAALETLALSKYNGGKRSIDALIAGRGGWTPGNHAAAANVARMMGVSPHADANLSDPGMMRRFRNGLMVQELGPGGARHVLDKLEKRDRGGRVSAGQSYVVGEQGWEIFKPRQSGEIVNQRQLAAQGRNAGAAGPQIGSITINLGGVHGNNPHETAAQVERILRNKVRDMFRGSHSDIGFAPT